MDEVLDIFAKLYKNQLLKFTMNKSFFIFIYSE